MSENPNCSVYIGNLDERLSERVLYDILIQAGRVVDLYIPRDKETDKPKGFAFAAYETQEIADYAIKLFSGTVTLCNRTLKFAFSGQDKASQGLPTIGTPSSRKLKPEPAPVPFNSLENLQPAIPSMASAYSTIDISSEPPPPGVTYESNGYGSRSRGINYDYSRRVLGTTLDTISRSRSGRYDPSNTASYPTY